MINGLNHITFSVTNLTKSIEFYRDVLKAEILVEGETSAYFNLAGVWLALNEEKNIPRNEIEYSYTHMAFTISDNDFDDWYIWLKENRVNILEGRDRDIRDKKSIYFTDLDGHKLELHTGSLEDRLNFYKEAKPHMKFYI